MLATYKSSNSQEIKICFGCDDAVFFHFNSGLQVLCFGGRDGWVVNPSENYNHWVERMRFQVNDTLSVDIGGAVPARKVSNC
ncbi:hypothetical protein V6N13_096376 [Hibiscus sabdariffa]|uniref:Galectin n=1 Tax=Hibiscus sabdariffa TaxID=183260 RepID=A0ABR2DGA6_9ROSI